MVGEVGVVRDVRNILLDFIAIRTYAACAHFIRRGGKLGCGFSSPNPSRCRTPGEIYNVVISLGSQISGARRLRRDAPFLSVTIMTLFASRFALCPKGAR